MNNPFNVWPASDPASREAWLRHYRAWPKKEPFAHPDFAAPFLTGNQRLVGLAWSGDAGGILMSLIVRPLSDEPWTKTSLCDAISPYGYGGAFAWGDVDAGLFWDHVDDWAAKSEVVSMFCRLSLRSRDILPFRGETAEVAVNIVRSLDLDDDALLRSYEHKVRKNINKAIRSGVTTVVDRTPAKIGDFHRIYEHTMDRRNAEPSYNFPLDMFHWLSHKCPDETLFIHGLIDDKVVCSELVLVGKESTYSFLGGTHSDAFEHRPNDLLKHEIIRWSRDQGKKSFVLGGGYAPNDGIFRFKQSFAPDGLTPFRVGRRVFDAPAYAQLIDQRRSSEPDWAPSGEFFPSYRAPNPVASLADLVSLR